jgi:hypothetical protein
MKALKKLKVNTVAAAIETDTGRPLPGLRESLAEAKAGLVGRVHTPQQILARRPEASAPISVGSSPEPRPR